MAAPQSPIGSRRRLGAELRRLRGKTGLTLDEVADMMTCSTSKISRLETGKGVPKIPDVRELMRIYGVASDTERDMLLRLVRDGREHGWWEPLTEGVAPERYVMDSPGRYAALESDAIAVRSFHVSVLHGLLQTPAYAHAVISGYLSNHSQQEIGQLVAMRAKRQEALNRLDPPPLMLDVVLDESVLRRVVGSAKIMADQLRRVVDLSALPTITIRVLPFTSGILRAHAGSFVLLEIPTALGADVVYIEGHAGETYLDSQSDVDLYRYVLNDVLAQALPADESLAMVRRYLHELVPRGK